MNVLMKPNRSSYSRKQEQAHMSVRTTMNFTNMRHPDHQQQSDIYICNEF